MWIFELIREINISSESISAHIHPATIPITIFWGAIVYTLARKSAMRERSYRSKFSNAPDIFHVSSDGVIYGVEGAFETLITWNAVSYYSISKTNLTIGVPSLEIEIELNDLKNFDTDTFASFMSNKGIKMVS